MIYLFVWTVLTVLVLYNAAAWGLSNDDVGVGCVGALLAALCALGGYVLAVAP